MVAGALALEGQLPPTLKDSLAKDEAFSPCSPSVSSSHASSAERDFTVDQAFAANAIHQSLVVRGLISPDTILRAFDKEYAVHKIILIAFSEFFETRFVKFDSLRAYSLLPEELAADGTKDGLPVYTVDCGPEMSREGFEFVLDVLYSKTTQKLSFDNVLQVLSSAQYLKVEHVLTQCLDFVLDNLASDSFLLCLEWASAHTGRAQTRVLSACRTLAKLAVPAHFDDWQDVLLGADLDFLRALLSAPDLAVASEFARYQLAKRIAKAAAALQMDPAPYRLLLSECIEYNWLTSAQLVHAAADKLANTSLLACAALWQLHLRTACAAAPADAEELPVCSTSYEALTLTSRPFTFSWQLSPRELRGLKTKLESPPVWYSGSKWHLQCSVREGCPNDYGLFVYRLPLPDEGSLASYTEDSWDRRMAVRMRFKLGAVICAGPKPRAIKEIEGGNVLKCGFGWGSREMVPKVVTNQLQDADRLVVLCTLAVSMQARPDTVTV